MFARFGTHSMVCCPEYVSENAILFPTDPGHPEYGTGFEYDYPDYEGDYNYNYDIDAAPLIEYPKVYIYNYSNML